MQASLRTFFILSLFLALLPAAVRAQEEMILEVDSGSDTTLASCDYAHRFATCETFHIETTASVQVGAVLRLDGRPYVLEWMGPGYYLESGVVLQPMGQGVPGLVGQRWLEVYPDEGRIHVSHAWKDLDGNRALSALDTLALDSGRALKVKDVRLNFRVKRAPAQP